MKNSLLPYLWLSVSILFLTLTFNGQICAQEDVTTGPAPLGRTEGGSKYFRGLTQDSLATASSIHVLGARGSADGLTLRVVVLEKSGNFMHSDKDKPAFRVEVGCKGALELSQTTPIVDEVVWRSSSIPTVGVICIDNSMTSENIAPGVIRSLRNSLPEYSGHDSLGVLLFSHELFEVSPVAPTVKVADRCNPDSLEAADGLAAVYSSMMSGLAVLSEHVGSSKVLILVTASDDVASVMYSSADVVRKANEIEAQIYVVRVGNSTHSFVYKYISTATGGKMFSLDIPEVSEAAFIVREIFYSAKQHYTVRLPLVAGIQGCDEALIQVTLPIGDGTRVLSDSLILWQKPKAYRTTRAIVATFADTTDVGLQNFYPILATLAEDLMSDSTRKVQLIGHVSPDIKGDGDTRGLERAGYISDFLHAYGVKRKQIVVRSDGSRKPLYYLQLDGTQRLLNNRVEARYLDEIDEPYTIVVEQVASEELAIRAVDTWEQRGYKSYFEPIVIKLTPAYRVKIWGYSSSVEAEKVSKDVKKRYSAAGIVE
ncbi:MAG: SPOR domain-containing protein [Ignavibacteria bacterium]|nr:SPOR domain-containing protein [Ignavibacteria bacterium]